MTPSTAIASAERNLVEVSLSALRDNAATLLRQAAPRRLIAVVKADAYGLGLQRAASQYLAAGVDCFAVASLGEARRLRQVAPRARVLVLGSLLPEERAEALALQLELCCSDAEELAGLASLAHPATPAEVHLFIDTGMGRAGCRPAEAPGLVALIRAEPRLRLAGLASHYPEAQAAEASLAQERCFNDLLQKLGPLPEDCLLHLGNSEGLLCRPASGNAVRVGLLLAGVVPDGCASLGLRLALRWRARAILVKNLPAGHGISYASTYRCPAPTRIAVVPVGYADGYPWAASNRAEVWAGGCRCRLLGRVTMDSIIIAVDACPEPVQRGSPVELLGPRLTPSELAAWAGTIPYDILCGLRGRCEVVGVADFSPLSSATVL